MNIDIPDGQGPDRVRVGRDGARHRDRRRRSSRWRSTSTPRSGCASSRPPGCGSPRSTAACSARTGAPSATARRSRTAFADAVTEWRTTDAFDDRTRLAAEYAERYALDHHGLDDEFWARMTAALQPARDRRAEHVHRLVAGVRPPQPRPRPRHRLRPPRPLRPGPGRQPAEIGALGAAADGGADRVLELRRDLGHQHLRVAVVGQGRTPRGRARSRRRARGRGRRRSRPSPGRRPRRG